MAVVKPVLIQLDPITAVAGLDIDWAAIDAPVMVCSKLLVQTLFMILWAE
jgi:hypothetical protein